MISTDGAVVVQGKSKDLTGGVVFIDYNHHEIHSSNHFYVSGGDQDLDSGEVINFTVVTPNTTKGAHMTFKIEGSKKYGFEIYEGATVNAAGTATTPINNNRNSAKTSGMTIRMGDTYTANGTLIFLQYYGKEGGTLTPDSEIILKQNTTYCFRISGLENDNFISYLGEWYEETF